MNQTVNTHSLLNVPQWKLRQEHDEEIKRCMEEVGSSFRSWKKETWPLLNECGHTSLDFDKCDCKNYNEIAKKNY